MSKGTGFDPRLDYKRRSTWVTNSFSMWDNKDLLIVDHLIMSGTWPSSQSGALACRRTQFWAPAVAVNQLFVLISCWLREIIVHERPLWLPVCSVTCVTHSALSTYSRPNGLGMRYTNPQIYSFSSIFFNGRTYKNGWILREISSLN
jgi:hypothetical protein